MNTGSNNNWFYRLDWGIIAIYVALVLFGWFNIYAAVYNDDFKSIFDFSQEYGKQFFWIIAAFVIAIMVLIVDSKFYSVFAYIIYAIFILLLISVLFFGKRVNGSLSWLEFGAMRLQPVELAKIATALALAKLMSAHDFRLKGVNSWAKVALILFLPIGFVLLQGDYGSALVFIAFFFMLYREGLSGWVLSIGMFMTLLFILALIFDLPAVVIIITLFTLLLFAFLTRNLRYPFFTLLGAVALFGVLHFGLFPLLDIHLEPDKVLLISSVLALAGGIIAYMLKYKFKQLFLVIAFFVSSLLFTYSTDYIYDNLLQPHHRDRIDDLLGIKVDLQGAGYNVQQSKVAIGSGGFTGKGFLQGTQTKYNFVPAQSTDFIFCTVGEEWGFLGTFMLIILYLTLLIRVLILAERQKLAFARIYGYCVASILFFHLAVNIAMTIGLAPVIGIPLPFISYGGSSLWSFTILLFIFLKLAAVRFGEKG